jgi:hypothetical protein
MKLTHFFLTLFLTSLISLGFAQEKPTIRERLKISDKKEKKPLIEMSVRQYGPYFGLQWGKYSTLEIGGEMQWKNIQIKTTKTHGATVGADFNIYEGVLGLSAGYYHKPRRFSLTYGGQLHYRTDFNNDRVGIAPVFGYKFMMLHAQVGYAFLSRNEDFQNTNNLFVSIRLSIMSKKEREVSTRWSKKNKDKK